MSIRNHDSHDSRVFEQDCAQYLRHLGIEAVDGDGINCPYRPTSDSGAFVVNGALFHDHARGEGGNVWQLALRMNNGDKRKALESLHQSAGIPFIANPNAEIILTEREKAHRALRKVYDAFAINAIDPAKTPPHVLEYLNNRKVSETTRPYFGFIPKGQLSTVLTDDEINLTGLKHREELIILWYLVAGEPIYYCTRDIATKAFKKASKENGLLVHPIWNVDALYRDANVVWGEGMFDCTSLMELGFGVAGEITCNLINEHKPQLLKALRWRAKHHPDWTFTICLDNDELTEDGRRPGNAAAEKIAVWLWGEGVDVKWVKHNPSDAADAKVDINLLHQNGLGKQVRQMIEDAPFVSEILTYDEELCLRNLPRMIAYQDYRGAERLATLMAAQNGNCKISEILRKANSIPWAWRDVYSDEIKDIFVYGSDNYVIFAKGRFGQNDKHYDAFKTNDLIRNLRRFQRNPTQQMTAANLYIEGRRPTWRVSKGEEHSKDEFNLFAPSPLLLQAPKQDAPLPDMWNKLFDNLAGAIEKEWLLNHMAVYVQTLEKPRTIPVLVGRQGTGKTVMANLFGEGIGGFMAVDNALIESQFNSYLMNAVVLLDELANSQRDSNQLKNRLKQLINENQSINAKHRETISVKLNNYVVIASNEQTSHVPLVIEKDDRRYCIITGGKDRDLAHDAWFDYQILREQLPAFMLYLLSRPTNKDTAAVPLLTEKKQQITDAGQDYKTACVRAFMEEKQASITDAETIKLSTLCEQINEKYNPQFKYLPKAVRPILEDLGFKMTMENHQFAVTVVPLVSPAEDKSDAQAGSGAASDDVWGL